MYSGTNPCCICDRQIYWSVFVGLFNAVYLNCHIVTVMMLVQTYLRALTIVECWRLVVAVCLTLSAVVPCRQLFRLVERVELRNHSAWLFSQLNRFTRRETEGKPVAVASIVSPRHIFYENTPGGLRCH